MIATGAIRLMALAGEDRLCEVRQAEPGRGADLRKIDRAAEPHAVREDEIGEVADRAADEDRQPPPQAGRVDRDGADRDDGEERDEARES